MKSKKAIPMQGKAAMFSSDKTEWKTSEALFNYWNFIFGFTLDVCATDINTQCDLYYDKEDNALEQDWAPHKCWMNPPYGKRNDIQRWLKKAHEESRKGALVVVLLPNREGTGWYRENIKFKPNILTHSLAGRTRFQGAKDDAPFESVIAIFLPLGGQINWR